MHSLRSTLEIARQTMRLLAGHRFVWLVVLGLLGCSALAWFGGAHPPKQMDGTKWYTFLSFWGVLQILLPWSAMFLGVQAVAGDLEDRTFQFLFLRPVPRWAILIGKWLGAAGLTAGLFAAGQLLLRFAVGLNQSVPFGTAALFAAVTAGASAAYVAMAAMFAAAFRRPLVWAAFTIVGLQNLVANLPLKAGLRQITVSDAVRRILVDNLEPDRNLMEMLWPAEGDAPLDHLGRPWRDLCVILATCLAVALWTYCRRDYDSRERE
jgi:hypothetical protein